MLTDFLTLNRFLFGSSREHLTANEFPNENFSSRNFLKSDLFNRQDELHPLALLIDWDYDQGLLTG